MFLVFASLVLTTDVKATFKSEVIIDSTGIIETIRDEETNIYRTILPMHLRPGDTVGLLSSAYRATDEKIEIAKKQLENFGFNVKSGKYISQSMKVKFPQENAERDFAGTDEERAEDLNNMFNDPEVKAIFMVRGGYGSNRILDLLDYKIIATHPKIIIGFSDITSLLAGIYSQTRLITFYGPMPGAYSPWPDFTSQQMKEVLCDVKNSTFINLPEEKIRTITSGVANGRIIVGNFATFNSLIGSKYFPNHDGVILLLEDVEENCRRIDRMMSQLKQAGILGKISGFIFGYCPDCCPPTEFNKILDEYIKPLKIPAWSGAMVGHKKEMFTLPFGAMVKIDADQGTITMIEDVVK